MIPNWITCRVSVYIVEGVHLADSEHNSLSILWLYSYNAVQGILKSIYYEDICIFDSNINNILDFLVKNKKNLVAYYRKPLSISIR